MTREIPVTQARADLADLVNRVAYTGERIMLTRHGKPLAALVPVADLESMERRSEIGFELPRPDVPAQADPARSDTGQSGAAPPGAAPEPDADRLPGRPGAGSAPERSTPAENPLRIAARLRPDDRRNRRSP
jgi:prevent-host-death family protein